jgi:hypothetical protein
MKKAIKIALIILAALILMITVFKVTYIGDGRIDDGTYEITGFDQYPDAYIVVAGDTVQFYNIDLNQIYQAGQMAQYKEVVEKNQDLKMTEEEVARYSDLNTLMVQNAYPINYDEQTDSKTGTFTYSYSMYPGQWAFGFGIEYDSFHKTIHIGHHIQELTFQK